MHSIKTNGYMRAVSEDTSANPLQTRLKLIITPFTPNANGVGIPRTEADNIIRTAQYQPLKINFDGNEYHGHAASIPIGPITSAYIETIDGEDVIAGEAIIWNEVYPDVVDFLKTQGDVHTSWEIYYTDASELDGVSWLNDCVFSGTVIVDNPAYRGKTPVLSIAEQQQNMEEMEALRAEVDALTNRLFAMVDALYTALNEAKPQLDTDGVESAFNSLVDKLRGMSEEVATVAELRATVERYEAAERDRAQAERDAARKDRLNPFGLADDRVAFYLTLEDEAFNAIVTDLAALRSKEVSSDRSAPIVPDPSDSPAPRKLSGRELAKELKQVLS